MNDKGHYIDAWDLLIAHPPCTYLSNAGARHLWKGHVLQADRVMKGIEGRDLFMRFWWADVPQICIENPIPSRVFCLPQYTQTIQPYEYGHPYSKRTCLWLKNLPPLFPTDLVTPIATWCPSGSYSKKHVGPGLKEYQFELLLNSQFGVNPRKVLNALQELCEAGAVDYFIINNRPLSRYPFKFEKMSDTWDVVHRFWGLKSCKVTLTLKEYV